MSLHRHYCSECGEHYTCRANANQCPKDWTCDTCEMDLMDAYWQANSHQAPLDFNAEQTEHLRAQEKLRT